MSPKLVETRTPIVLVVDDVPANRELLEGHLEALGYDVRQARDGVEALEAVAAEEPDLMLLDVDMPRLDGIAVCERLKMHPTRRLIPVVILTASNDREVRLRGIAAGARDRYTIYHAERVGRYAQAIGAAHGLDAEDGELLYQGGVLHDLGKIA